MKVKVAVTKLIPLVNFKTPPVASRSSEASVVHNHVATAQTKLPKATNHSRNTTAASRLSSSQAGTSTSNPLVDVTQSERRLVCLRAKLAKP